jgi:hypothetical protein
MSPMDLSLSCVTGEILIANRRPILPTLLMSPGQSAKLPPAVRSTNHISLVDTGIGFPMR